MHAANSRLAVREIPESDEFAFYLAAYHREVREESRLLGALAVVGAVLGLVAIAWLLVGGAA